MICNAVLISQGKSYPRTCAVHGLGPCPELKPKREGLQWIQRYARAEGEVNRQWIVNEILQHDDGRDNAVHRVLREAAELL